MPREDGVHLIWMACYDIFNMFNVIFCKVMNYRSKSLHKTIATNTIYDKNDIEIN